MLLGGATGNRGGGAGSAFVLGPTPVDPRLSYPTPPPQKAHWALSGPASGARSLTSPSLTSSSLRPRSPGFPTRRHHQA